MGIYMNDYEAAMRTLQQHIRQEPDGTFTLTVAKAEDIGIDPILFADLKRSMDETNRHIQAGDYQLGDVSQWSLS